MIINKTVALEHTTTHFQVFGRTVKDEHASVEIYDDVVYIVQNTTVIKYSRPMSAEIANILTHKHSEQE